MEARNSVAPAAATRELRMSMADGLIFMVEKRDAQIAEHLRAVGSLAADLAQKLGLPEAAIERITISARLHDIGKQAIPLEILNKPMSLSSDEWTEMRTHPAVGAGIVAAFPQMDDCRSIIRSHHERVDGRGYPDGLLGYEIPYEARIIAIADAFHAMTVARPYTRLRAPSAALEEIQHCAGTQFDKEFTHAFVEMMGGRFSHRPAVGFG